MQIVGGSDGKRGTFLPDPQVFTGAGFDFTVLEQRFRAPAGLNANVTLALVDKRGEDRRQVVIHL